MTYASSPAPHTRNAPRGIAAAFLVEVTAALSRVRAGRAEVGSADALDDVAARGLASQVGVALVLEAGRRLLQLVEQAGELVASLLTLGAQALTVPDLPGPQHGREHLVLVDAQVVDASHRDLHGAAPEVL